MRLTKYDHACVVLEDQGQKVIIDPGAVTSNYGDIQGVAAVVVTHGHADHFSAENIAAIVEANPNVQVLTTGEVAAHITGQKAVVVAAGENIVVGPFTLQFYGEKHALVHGVMPDMQNIGVRVNDGFYYPGDSLTVPTDGPVKVLAVPACAPWLKVSEAMDFIQAIKPETCFPTHNGMLTVFGQAVTDNWLKQAAESANSSYVSLKSEQAIEL